MNMGPKIALHLSLSALSDASTPPEGVITLRVGLNEFRSVVPRHGTAYKAAIDTALALGLVAVMGLKSGTYRWESKS